MMKVGRQDRGDTFVEVILAIALISIVLVGAFNIIGASYRTAMLSKERVEAVSLAQQQAERLRLKRDNHMASGAYNPANPFDATVFPQTGELLNADLSKRTCGGGCVDGLYTTTLTVVPNAIAVSGNTLKTYSIKVQWTQAGTSDTNETEIIFKLSDRNPDNIQRDCAVVESCS